MTAETELNPFCLWAQIISKLNAVVCVFWEQRMWTQSKARTWEHKDTQIRAAFLDKVCMPMDAKGLFAFLLCGQWIDNPFYNI